MSAELVAFLRARLDEDEQLARDLDGARWQRQTLVGDEYNFGEVVEVGGGPVASCGVEFNEDGEIRAAHIARHDPARVLAEVAAKRRLSELLAGGESLTGRRVGEEYRLGILDALRLLSEPYDTDA